MFQRLCAAILENSGGVGGGEVFQFAGADAALRAREDAEWAERATRDGLLVARLGMKNRLFNEGKLWLAQQAFHAKDTAFLADPNKNAAALYLYLLHDGANTVSPLVAQPPEDRTLATLPVSEYEPTGDDCPGYNRKAVSRVPGGPGDGISTAGTGISAALVAGNVEIKTAYGEWIAGADWRYAAGAEVGELVKLAWIGVTTNPAPGDVTGVNVALMHLQDVNTGLDITREMLSGTVLRAYYGAKLRNAP